MSPVTNVDSCCRTCIYICRHCSTHAFLTFVTGTAVIDAILWWQTVLTMSVYEQISAFFSQQNHIFLNTGVHGTVVYSGLLLCISVDRWQSDTEKTLHRHLLVWSTRKGHTSLMKKKKRNDNETVCSVIIQICIAVQISWLNKSWEERLAVPLLTLWLQGFSNINLMSEQLTDVFQVLAKATAVPSTNPLVLMKSSRISLLKFPHKPVGVQFN